MNLTHQQRDLLDDIVWHALTRARAAHADHGTDPTSPWGARARDLETIYTETVRDRHTNTRNNT